ncbi:hypothetical protein [Streptomyces sp. NPDC003006]
MLELGADAERALGQGVQEFVLAGFPGVMDAAEPGFVRCRVAVRHALRLRFLVVRQGG